MPAEALAECGLRHVGREVDRLHACTASRRPCRCRGSRSAAACSPSAASLQKEVVWPSSASTTWWPFGRYGSSSLVAFDGRVAKSSVPPIRSVSTFEVRTRLYSLSLAFAGHALSMRPPAQMNSVAGLPRIESLRCPPADEVALCCAGIGPAMRLRCSPQTNDSGKASLLTSDWNQNPLASPFSADSHELEGHRRGERLRRRRRLHEAEEGREPHVALVDRQEPPPIGHVRGRTPHRRGEVVGPRAAGVVLRAEVGVVADLVVRRPRVAEEVTGRVDADHHRAVDALRVAPGVDQSRCGCRRSR